MFLFPPLSTLVGFLCVGERYWMCLETYSYMFLSWYVQKPGHPPELLFYEVTWSQCDTHGSRQQQWLYDWHWSTGYSEHTVQEHPHNRHFAHSEIHTTASTLHSRWCRNWLSLWGMLQVLKQNESQKHRRHMIRNDCKSIFNIFIKCSTCDESKQGVKTRKQR